MFAFRRATQLGISKCARFSTKANVKPEIMELGNLNHVAIATKDIKSSANFWKTVMGASKVSEIKPQPEHGVNTVFVDIGETKIELLEPLGEKSPIANFLEKNHNGGIHHICINVKSIEKALERITQKGVRALGKPKIGAHGLPVVFLHPKDCNGVLVELEEHN